ncbi:MAG: FecR domain-containing protein [Pseudomonadota bacterium]
MLREHSPSEFRVTKDMLRAAHEWRVTLSDDGVSPEDRARFAQWYDASPLHAHAFDQAETFWQALGTLKAEQINAHYLVPGDQERRAKPLLAFHWYQWAAGVAALFIVTLLIRSLVGINGDSDIMATERSFVTAIGESLDVTLDDGTQLSLGPSTELRVVFGQRERALYLTTGQIFLDVASDPDRPLVASVGAFDARVVGTAFDLRSISGKTSVEVVEGVVAVSYPYIIRGELSELRRSRTVNAGSGVSASKETGLVDPYSINSNRIGAWRKGRLIFEDTLLSDMIDDLNRYNTRSVRLNDPDGELSTATVTGAFDASDTDSILTTLTEILPVTLSEMDGVVEIIPASVN